MLSTQNSGKYLTREWNDPDGERQRCLYDMRQFTEAECEYYEVCGTGPNDGLGYQLDENLIIETSPVDTETDPRAFDVRDLPEGGH
ncbi:MAG: hypothetical protein WC277_08230 [Bacilli bacterium]